MTNLIGNKDIILCGNNDIIKANIDIEKEIVHIGKSAHCDMEFDMYKEGSKRGNLAGINIFIDNLKENEEIDKSMIEFSSMINYDINKFKIGDLRSGNIINNRDVQNQIMEILEKWLIQ